MRELVNNMVKKIDIIRYEQTLYKKCQNELY